jgi:hypothetical protein
MVPTGKAEMEMPVTASKENACYYKMYKATLWLELTEKKLAYLAYGRTAFLGRLFRKMAHHSR